MMLKDDEAADEKIIGLEEDLYLFSDLHIGEDSDWCSNDVLS